MSTKTSPGQVTVYHVTPRRNLGSIMRWGLIPRDPTDGQPGWGDMNRGTLAVYVMHPVEEVGYWQTHPSDRYYAVPLTVLALDVTGLPVEPDAYNPHVWSRVLVRVEPGRIGRAA